MDKKTIKCSICGKPLPIDTKPGENWKYYCTACGMVEILKEIGESNSYYGRRKDEGNII